MKAKCRQKFIDCLVHFSGSPLFSEIFLSDVILYARGQRLCKIQFVSFTLPLTTLFVCDYITGFPANLIDICLNRCKKVTKFNGFKSYLFLFLCGSLPIACSFISDKLKTWIVDEEVTLEKTERLFSSITVPFNQLIRLFKC